MTRSCEFAHSGPATVTGIAAVLLWMSMSLATEFTYAVLTTDVHPYPASVVPRTTMSNGFSRRPSKSPTWQITVVPLIPISVGPGGPDSHRSAPFDDRNVLETKASPGG